MIKILTELDESSYRDAVLLWELTGVGNPARGDSYQAVEKTLKHGARLILHYNDNLATGTVWLTHDYRRLYVHHMAVHVDYQGSGIGKLLLKEALKIAKELNLQAKLEVHKENPVACKLYESHGFRTLDGYHTMIKRDI